MLTIKEVRDELWRLWMPAKSRGERAPPPSRVTVSFEGYKDLLSDREIRGHTLPSDVLVGLATILGAELVIDKARGVGNREKLTVELIE